jgi:hypothetical protein
MPISPSEYSRPPAITTRNAPNRSAAMPEKMPATPQVRFWIAMARAKVSRVQPWACVTGCSHSPKAWRVPMDSVKTAAPQISIWASERCFVAEELIGRL